MTDTRSKEHFDWRTRIRAWGFVAGAFVFVLVEGYLLAVISGQLTVVVINPLLGQLHPVFRQPLDPIWNGNDSWFIPRSFHGTTIPGVYQMLLIIGWGHVRQRTVTWPYCKLFSPSPQFRSKLGIPSEKSAKSMDAWKAIVVFAVELGFVFIVSLPIILLDPLIGAWSVIFWFIAPVGWFALRGVVALVRGRGPWPYAERPKDVLYILWEDVY